VYVFSQTLFAGRGRVRGGEQGVSAPSLAEMLDPLTP